MSVARYVLDEGVSYRAVTPSVIRYIWNVGLQMAAQWERKLETFQFNLGAEHPVYQSNAENLPGKNSPYAFYMRVPDLPAFLRQITPVLEQRLAHSVVAGHQGELKVSFYRGGVKLTFEKGHITAVEDWKPKVKEDEGMAAFPDLTFLQLVFGYRTLEEVRHAYADCWANADATVLLGALFPKRSSHIWAIS
jgi:hypothetical protein